MTAPSEISGPFVQYAPMPTEPLIPWPKPFFELANFIASFLAAGAAGFWIAVLRRMPGPTAGADERRMFGTIRARAATLGLVGAMIGIVLVASELPATAARQHLTVPGLVAGNPMLAIQIVLMIAATLGYTFAALGRAAGWPIAVAAVIANPLRAVAFGEWLRIVNPTHKLAAGLWIGTLFILVAVGLGTVLRSGLSSERRGALAAEMVYAFSPLALVASGVLALFGVITAWRHLKYVAALWTTPYGYALIVKLIVVAGVVALGAWNWRRQKPRLGSEGAVFALRRSASAELTLAAVVLLITAILVSLPTPKLPGS